MLDSTLAVNDGDPQRIEKLKERNVKGETNSKIPEHAPGWSESLSSQVSRYVILCSQRASTYV